MADLLFYGEQLLETLQKLGDWFTTPAGFSVPVLNVYDWTWHFVKVPLPFGYTVAELLLGGGLLFLLGFRLLKFWTDVAL